MTTQRKPKSVTIPQAEYSALLGVVAAHRADAGLTTSKVLDHYDSVVRKPSLTPHEADQGGMVYLIKSGGTFIGEHDTGCAGCAQMAKKSLDLCGNLRDRPCLIPEMREKSWRPVRAVG